jgi:hypothetical protein
MGTVKAGPIGIRAIMRARPAAGGDRQNIVRARIGGLHKCVRLVNIRGVAVGAPISPHRSRESLRRPECVAAESSPRMISSLFAWKRTSGRLNFRNLQDAGDLHRSPSRTGPSRSASWRLAQCRIGTASKKPRRESGRYCCAPAPGLSLVSFDAHPEPGASPLSPTLWSIHPYHRTFRPARERSADIDWVFASPRYAMWAAGQKLPSQKPSSLMRCPCGVAFDSHDPDGSYVHRGHIYAAQAADGIRR